MALVVEPELAPPVSALNKAAETEWMEDLEALRWPPNWPALFRVALEFLVAVLSLLLLS